MYRASVRRGSGLFVECLVEQKSQELFTSISSVYTGSLYIASFVECGMPSQIVRKVFSLNHCIIFNIGGMLYPCHDEGTTLECYSMIITSGVFVLNRYPFISSSESPPFDSPFLMVPISKTRLPDLPQDSSTSSMPLSSSLIPSSE